MPLTVCPLSNIKLKVFAAVEDHNIKRLLERGLCVTVNSDDPAYFGGYLLENFVAIERGLGLTQAELTTLARNSFEASFLEPAESATGWRRSMLTPDAERVNPPVGDPDLADVGAPGVVDDFLQDVGRRVGAVETQIAVLRARIDQHCVELKAFLEHPDGQIERDAPAGRGEPEGCGSVDAGVGAAALITLLRGTHS